MQRRSFSLPLSAPPAVKFEGGKPAFLVVPGLISRRRSFSLAVAGNGDSRLPNWNPSSPFPFPFLSTVSMSASGQAYYSASAPPPRQLLELKALCFRPSPQLGLLSLLFALSMVIILPTNWSGIPLFFVFLNLLNNVSECGHAMQAIGAIISLAVLSIPTINVSLLFLFFRLFFAVHMCPLSSTNYFSMQFVSPIYFCLGRLLQDWQPQ